MYTALLIFFSAVFTFLTGVTFQVKVMGEGRLKFLKKRLKKLHSLSHKQEFEKEVSLLVSGKKNHWLGLRMFAPLLVPLGLAFANAAPIIGLVGTSVWGLTHLLGTLHRNGRKKFKRGRPTLPWEFNPGEVTLMVIQTLIELPDVTSRKLLTRFRNHKNPLTQHIAIGQLTQAPFPWAVKILEMPTLVQRNEQLLIPARSKSEQLIDLNAWEAKIGNSDAKIREKWLPLVLLLDIESRRDWIEKARKDPSGKVRELARNLWWRSEGVELVNRILAFAQTCPEPLDQQVLEQLANLVEFGGEDVYLAVSDLFLDERKRWREIHKRDLLAGDPDFLLEAVIMVLAEIPGKEANEALIQLLGNPNESVCQAAFEVLEEKTDLTVEYLDWGLSTSNKKVHYTLPEIATRYEWKEVEKFMDRILESEDRFLRVAAVKTLDHWNTEDASLDRLLAQLQAPIRVVRAQALADLDHIGEPPVLDLLMQALKNHYQSYHLEPEYETNPDEATRIERIIAKVVHLLGGKQGFQWLFCKRCLTRTITRKVHGITFPLCRKCKRSRYLLPRIAEVRGRIGPGGEDGPVETGSFEVDLWNPKKEKAKYADIDVLEIMGGAKFDYDWAVNAVLESQENGSPMDPWKVRVELKNDPPLHKNSLNLIQEVTR